MAGSTPGLVPKPTCGLAPPASWVNTWLGASACSCCPSGSDRPSNRGRGPPDQRQRSERRNPPQRPPSGRRRQFASSPNGTAGITLAWWIDIGRVKLTNPDKVLYPATGDHQAGGLRLLRQHRRGDAAAHRRPRRDPQALAQRRRRGVVLREATGRRRRRTGCTAEASRTGPAPPPTRSSTASRGWPGSPSRPRWRSTCRSGGSSGGRVAGKPSPARPPAWCSTWTPARA